MSKITISKEVNLLDIIKAIVGFVAAVFIYFAITQSEQEANVQSSQLELARQLPDLIPTVHNNYANQLSPDGHMLTVKVYVRVTAKLPVNIFYPRFDLIDAAGDTLAWSQYGITGQRQFQGIYAPGSHYQLSYFLFPKDSISLEGYKLHMSYRTEVPQKLQQAYRKVFYNTSDGEWAHIAESVMKFKSNYTQRVFANGTNPDWEDFFENPR